MSYRIYQSLALFLWLLASLNSTQVTAQDQTAYALVQETTVRVMEVVAGAQEYAEGDPERYYRQIQDLLDPLIDFRGFARKVMGPYASSERYRSLDESGRQQLRDQLDRFTGVMGGSLVRHQAAPPAQCPIRKELARVRAGGVLQEAQEALDNGGQAWIDSLADINVGD